MSTVSICISDKSAHGAPPLWQLDIRAPEGLDPGHIHVSVQPELFAFETNWREIDRLGKVIQMHLHDIRRGQSR